MHENKESEETEVKKDKLWAKSKIREELDSWRYVEGGIDRDGINYVLNIIDQIDEPEVLSQVSIDNDGVHVRGLGDIVEAEAVENIILPNQVLPVVPNFVDEWLTKYREDFDLYTGLKELEDNTLGWERTYKWYKTNTHEFVNAYLTGKYEVKEEPLYYALIKGHELMDDEGHWTCNHWNISISDGHVFPGDRFSQRNKTLIRMTKAEWSEYGINETNAEFRKVGEVAE